MIIFQRHGSDRNLHLLPPIAVFSSTKKCLCLLDFCALPEGLKEILYIIPPFGVGKDSAWAKWYLQDHQCRWTRLQTGLGEGVPTVFFLRFSYPAHHTYLSSTTTTHACIPELLSIPNLASGPTHGHHCCYLQGCILYEVLCR